MARWNRRVARHSERPLEHTARLREHGPGPPVKATSWWRLEAPVVVAILAVAALLRFYDLTEFPSGLHDDEAITGLEGQRILSEGWIGVYSSLDGEPSFIAYVPKSEGPFPVLYVRDDIPGTFGPLP